MIVRALVLALSCAYVATLGPLSPGAEDNDCALYLTGPGRSSAYDYSINLLKGNFGYDGKQTCITYEAINQAYLEARNRILVSQPKGKWGPEDYGSVGELVLDISINLARRYGLTYEEIEKGLPLIDTSRTLIREVCPPTFSHVECRAGKYRRFDGLCNNLQHPTWGATMAPFQRLIGPLFSDGINAPRISHTGHDLPLSRVVSRTMHPDDGFHDHAGTVMVIAWGQFMDHDYTLTGTPLDPRNRNDPEECCKRPPHLKHPYCNEIRIPDDDYFYRLFGVKCIDFVRAFPSPRPGCRLGSRIPFNTLTGTIDGNTVYGVTDKFARKLRTGFGGLLRMNPVFKEYGLKDLLPLKLDIPDEGCTRPNKNMYCFEAGEIRVNEQLILTVMHTLMAREHNRVARGLAEVNPHWDDETLFQEARRITIAEIQHITYNEFLPILLGKDVMEKFGLVLEKEGYWDGYDPNVNPDVIASFASAAYRFGHSLLPTAVERWSKAHKFIASKRLSDLIRRPYDLYRAGVFDEYVMGLMNQVAQAMDDSITQEVTNHLFKKVGARFGMDLVSFNMQRGREFGIPGYMEFRKFCGLPDANSFQDLFGTMSNHTVRKYETIFEHPIDVDLWSGGVSERPLPGSMLGPTFACIIATQFSYSRRGDRFWFELRNQASSFTPEQLAELRKSRLSRIICDNTDIIDTVQLYPFVLPDHELNPRVPCRSGIIPGMDFSKWAEPAQFHGNAKEYITEAYLPPANNTNEDSKEVNTPPEKTVSDNLCLNINTKSNLSNTCNETENAKLLAQNSNLDISNKHNTQNQSVAKLPSKDTILKYVYKKDDKINDKQKTQGHKANSLKRRKRDTFPSNNKNKKRRERIPVIVNYDTNHSPREFNKILPARLTDESIKNSNLADFNIETIHDDERRVENSDYTQDKPRSYVENNQRDDHEDGTKSIEELSSEQEESGESIKDKNEGRENDRGKIRYRNRNPGTSYEARSESLEDDTNKSNENDRYTNENASLESDENKDTHENYKSESIEENKGLKTPIQEVDDFSYENIQVNEKGEVEVASDKPDNNNSKLPAALDDKVGRHNELQSISQKNTDTSASLEERNESKEPININDGEIKPVVELNSESTSKEDSDENIKEALTTNIDNDGNPLKTVINEGHNHEEPKKKKILRRKNKKVDVKQQFERIPLNHNEVKKKDAKIKAHKNTNFDDNDGTLESLVPKQNNYDDNLNIKFDDLTIKLPEIKLPDDVLSYAYEEPVYTYGKNNDKTDRYYHYDNRNDRDDKKQKKNENNKDGSYNNDGHYRYYGDENEKQDYKKNNKDDDDKGDDYDDDHEDLYEKFVRERFGKKDSFQKRSERLQDVNSRPQNPDLYKNIKNILKKTQEVQKEAEISGDPKAGYAWTLEYGENA